MLAYLLQGIALGFPAGVSPGPLQTFFFSQAIRVGWKKTLPAAFAPLISDGPIILLVLFILNITPEWFLKALQIAGGIFIIYLGWRAFQTFRQDTGVFQEPAADSRQSLLTATFMNLLNPNPYIYWSTIMGPILIKSWRENPVNSLGFLAGFYATMIGISIALIILFSTARRFGGRVNHWLVGISSLLLFGFGVFNLYNGVVR